MSSQFDRVWSLQYDEDSYHKPMAQINFSKYLNSLLTNQYFPAFQKQVFEQMNNEAEWNQRSWIMIKLFEYLNDAFNIHQFDTNVKFIANKQTRKVFGAFRMWIDLERIYLLSFLKLDRIEFQENRIYFSLYRLMLFLNDLLSQYQITDFKRQFIQKIGNQITKYMQMLGKNLPSSMNILLKSIKMIIPNFISKYILIQYKDKDQIKKTTFRKLSKQFETVHDTLQRLKNQIQLQTRQRQIKYITSIAESPQILQLTKPTEEIYDPRIRIIFAMKRQSKSMNVPYNEQKVEEKLKQYRAKQKEKLTSEPAYQSLMRTGHNPYEESNFTIYGEILSVDMNQKQQLEKNEQQEQVSQVPVDENKLYYQPQYLANAEKLKINSVAVTYDDLNKKALQSKKKEKLYNEQNSALLKNLNWDEKYPENKALRKKQDDDDDEDKEHMSTVRSITAKKNLQNNAIFQKHEQQEKEKTILMLQKTLRNGLNSDLLFHLDKRAQKILQSMERHGKPRFFDLNGKAILDNNKFDSLRKVAQYHAINKKLSNWMNAIQVPSHYPRGVQEIKRLSVDTTIDRKRQEAALQFIDE